MLEDIFLSRYFNRMNLRIMDEIDLYVSMFSTRRISERTYVRLYRYEWNFFPNESLI